MRGRFQILLSIADFRECTECIHDVDTAVKSKAVAERASGAHASQALLRWSLIIVFLWFGGMKFTSYEAHGIAPFIANSSIMSWLHVVFGIQGASYVIGTLELSTAVALPAGAFVPVLSALGAAMSAMTYLITLTFFVTTPGVAEATSLPRLFTKTR